MAVVRHWHSKHISAATYTPAMVKERRQLCFLGDPCQGYITRTNGTNESTLTVGG
jgi:hypothetical protein